MSSSFLVMTDGQLRRVKRPHIRRGPGLPQLLAAFPDPPDTLLIATSAKSSPLQSPISPVSRVLPPIGKPPTGPLPDIPVQSSSYRRSKDQQGRERERNQIMSVDNVARSRTPSPDLSAILSSSVRKSRSRVHLNGHTARGESIEGGKESGNESAGSESSIDIHTPLPNLMVREGLISPTSKALASLSRSASPAPSNYSFASGSTAFNSIERQRRKMRHRNNKVLREGLGLTTGLGWSDSEDEDEGGMGIMRRLSKVSSSSSLRARGCSSSIRSAPPTSARFLKGQHQHTPSTLSRCTTSTTGSSTSNNSSKTHYSAFSAQKPHSTTGRGKRSDSNGSTTSNGSGPPLSPTSDTGSFRSQSSRKIVQPMQSRTRLTSIGETSKPTEFGQFTKEPNSDIYGKTGFNYSAPRTSARHSVVSNSSLTSSVSSRNSDITTPKPPPNRVPPPVPTTPSSTPSTNHRPRFRHGMDERVRRLEEKLQRDLNHHEPPGGDSDTEREPDGTEIGRSRTPTPNSPGTSLSTDSLSSLAMPLTPRNERSLIDIARDNGLDNRERKGSESSISSYGTVISETTETSRMVTPTARLLQLPPSPSSSTSTPTAASGSAPAPPSEPKLRPILTASQSSSNLPTQSILSTRKRSGSASSTPSGLTAPSSIFSRSLPLPPGILMNSRSSSKPSPTDSSSPQSPSQVIPPTRPAPAPTYITPSSVEYAQTRSLHPLTTASRLARTPHSAPTSATGTTLSPLPESLRPRATTLHPLSHPPTAPTVAPSHTFIKPRSFVSRITPRKLSPQIPITRGGIGAGGVSRV